MLRGGIGAFATLVQAIYTFFSPFPSLQGTPHEVNLSPLSPHVCTLLSFTDQLKLLPSKIRLLTALLLFVVQLLTHVRLFATPWLQHARLLTPPLSPKVCSNSCPLSRWCYLTISSSVISFSFNLQSFPASGSFQMSQLCTSGGQIIGASALASVLPMNIQDWFPLGLTGLISLLSKGLSRVFSSTSVFKGINSLVLSLLYGSTLTSIYNY